jgi:putative ABC transport system ATP-binding protein
MSEASTQREQAEGVMEPPLIELAGVEKVYRMGKLDYRALRGVDLSIGGGEMVAVVGPSGSGKSTILNMITGIDRPDRRHGDVRRHAAR